jgi:hypothetical protein
MKKWRLSAKQKKALKVAGWSAFGITAIMVAREAYLTFGPNRENRRKLFEAALARATEIGRPLIVLGDPDGGLIHHMLGRDFQCGMICIDPKGCGVCAQGGKSVADDPAHALSTMAANSAVIFDSGLFAFADDGYALAEQLVRVSGGHGNLFMFDVPRFTFTSWLESKRKRVLKDAPPESPTISWKNGIFTKEPRTGQTSGALALSGVRGLGYGPGVKSMYYYERLVERYPPPRGSYYTTM